MPDQALQAPNRRTDNAGICIFVLCLESPHIFLFFLFSLNYFWRIPLVLASPSLDSALWVISGAIAGIANYCIFRPQSRVISRIGLAVGLGSVLTAASMIIEPSPSVSVIVVLGAALMSGGTIIVTCLQLQMSQQLFGFASEHVALRLLSSLLSPLLVLEVWAAGSLLLVVWIASRRPSFDTYGFIEGAEMGLYPYTVVLFVALATQLLWLPVIAKWGRTSSRAPSERTAGVRAMSRKPDTPRDAALLVMAMMVGILICSYRLILGYPLTGDARYYLSILREMDRLGVAQALSTDRPLLFLALYSVRTCLSIEAEALLNYLQIVLTGALTASTYLLIGSCFKDERLAALSAFLASISPHVTIGIRYFIIGNWFALVLLMLLYVAMLKSQEEKSQRWVILAVVLSWLILGIHYPTWLFAVLILIAYSLISLKVRPLSETGRFLPVKIALGSLLAVLPIFLVSLAVPEMSATFQDAWSKVVMNLAQVGPLNFVRFLQDEVLLSSYFAKGSYAMPLTYALSLFGLYRLYRIREDHAQLVLSWTIVSTVGILVIPRVEQWRLLYMVPMEVLAAEGVIYIVTLMKLLKDSHTANGRDKLWPRGALLIFGLLACGAASLLFSAPLLPVVLCFMIVEWFLLCDLAHGEVSQMVAIEIVLLYVLAGTAHALYSLG